MEDMTRRLVAVREQQSLIRRRHEDQIYRGGNDDEVYPPTLTSE